MSTATIVVLALLGLIALFVAFGFGTAWEWEKHREQCSCDGCKEWREFGKQGCTNEVLN